VSEPLDYQSHAAVDRKRISIPWLLAAAACATAPFLLRAYGGRAPRLFSAVTLIACVAATVTCALVAVRLVWLRWWATVLLVLCGVLALSGRFVLPFALGVGARRGEPAELAPHLARLLPYVLGVAGFAWLVLLPVIAKRRGAEFKSVVAKRIAVPLLVLALLALSAANAMVLAATMLFTTGTIVARGVSPDGKMLALAQRSGFLDTSNRLLLQSNSVFAVRARSVGGGGGTGRATVGWTEDSRYVSMWVDGQLAAAYDTQAKRPLHWWQGGDYRLSPDGNYAKDPHQRARILAADPLRGAAMLAYAAGAGEADIARVLLDAGVDVNAATQSKTPLFTAVDGGHLEIARLLLDRGAKVDLRSVDETPLHCAARNGNETIVALLLEHGADINARSWSWGSLPVIAPVAKRHHGVLKLLLQRGADPNGATSDTGQTALIIAASYGDTVAIRMLLDHGADLAMKNKSGQTAIDVARKRNHAAAEAMLSGR
jgi:ankyrin repeat protein